VLAEYNALRDIGHGWGTTSSVPRPSMASSPRRRCRSAWAGACR
jgi:hypothetical protein